MSSWAYILILFALVGGFLPLFIFWKRVKKKRQVLRELAMTLYLVKMPRFRKEEYDIKKEISKMEQILSHFLYLKRPKFLKKFIEPSPRVALEIASQVGGLDICFYVAVPNEIATSFENYIHGAYPEAEVEIVPEDYTVFEPKGKVACSFLKLQKSQYLPIATYKNLESDPLENIVVALSRIYPEEGAAVQIILQPTKINLEEKGEKIIEEIKQGQSFGRAVLKVEKGKTMKLFDVLSETISPSKKEKTQEDEEKKRWLQEMNLRENQVLVDAIKSKIYQPAFEVNIRLIGVAKEEWRAKEILHYLESAFLHFTSNFNGFEPARVQRRRKKEKFVYNFSFRNFSPKERIILNLEEIASIYHFPLPHIKAPHIKWLKTRESAPPIELPQIGEVLIGKTVFRGEEKNVYFATKEDRRRHFYIVGQTGTGKTSLLREMIRQDMEKGRGVAVIDPHGDLIEATLANVPQERIEDVILFEPFDLENPMGLNMLEWDTERQRDFAVAEMITIFSHLFPPEIVGPMFEHYMRNAMLALMADKNDPGTLVEIPRIFTDEEFMRKKVEKVKDPLVRNFWLKEWAQTTQATRSDMVGYVVSKVGRFVENEMMRNIIGQKRSSFNFETIINEGKIFLANLSKGKVGELNSALLGMILVSKFQISAMKRAEIPEEQRKDFYLYIDEFQNFTTPSVATILSEARKYRLCLILAHQFIPQLTEEIKNAVIGNVANIGVFRVGPFDAEFLEQQFDPVFTKYDLLNLDNYNFACKMVINGQVSDPFKVKTIPPKEGRKELVESIKKISKLKYARPKELVEREILKRSHF